MRRIILDASALIAVIFEEKGSQTVEKYLPRAVMSTVNIAEVASYMIEKGMDSKEIQELLKDLSLETIAYDETHAFLAASLRGKTKSKGLSLGDRSCLALALAEKLPVLTADRAWANVDIGVKVELIR